VPGLFGRDSRLFRRVSGSLRGVPRILRGVPRILGCAACALGRRSRGLGGLARPLMFLQDVIECFAILLLKLTRLFGDLPDAFGFAAGSFVHDATCLGDSTVLFFRTRRFGRRIRGVVALIRH
jgi:hypothetical protein